MPRLKKNKLILGKAEAQYVDKVDFDIDFILDDKVKIFIPKDMKKDKQIGFK